MTATRKRPPTREEPQTLARPLAGSLPIEAPMAPELDSRSVASFARESLAARLATVWRELEAIAAFRTAVEPVHRLRVATRRCLAAIECFEPILCRRRAAWFGRRLHHLRRLAGEARDLDVLVDQLAASTTSDASVEQRQEDRFRHRLARMLAHEAHASRDPLVSDLETLLSSNWSERSTELLDTLDTTGQRRSLRPFARRRLQIVSRRFLAAAGLHEQRERDLHRLRILGKKLRYSLEILGPLLPADPVEEFLASLESMQAKLGGFTDHAAAVDRLRGLSRKPGAGHLGGLTATLIAQETKATARAAERFRRWWTRKRRKAFRACLQACLAAEWRKSLPPQEAATDDSRQPRHFPGLPAWKKAMDGLSHGHRGEPAVP
jgi:CHAD domain-containing protein